MACETLHVCTKREIRGRGREREREIERLCSAKHLPLEGIASACRGNNLGALAAMFCVHACAMRTSYRPIDCIDFALLVVYVRAALSCQKYLTQLQLVQFGTSFVLSIIFKYCAMTGTC